MTGHLRNISGGPNSSLDVIIDLIISRCFTHELLLCFILLHISNGSASTSLVEHVLYLADLMSATCKTHYYLMVHRYIYSRYSSVFPILYQLYYFLPSSTLILSSSLYLKLQPELLLKVIILKLVILVIKVKNITFIAQMAIWHNNACWSNPTIRSKTP